MRSLDYLASHPLVDPRRLASTGQSGGGTTTMLLAAVDDRLAAAAPCCGNTENVACANFIPPGSTDDAEQDLIASGPVGFDRWDLLYPLAPKPLLVLVSERDFFGTYSPNYITSGTEEFRKLRAVYETLGHAERIAWYGSPLPHGLSYAMRLQIYSWFGRWLKGDSRPVTVEPETAPEPDSTLYVSESGSVVRSFQGETPFTLLQKHAVAQAARRPGDPAGRRGARSRGPRDDARHFTLPPHAGRGPGVRLGPEGMGARLAVPAGEERSKAAAGHRARTVRPRRAVGGRRYPAGSRSRAAWPARPTCAAWATPRPSSAEAPRAMAASTITKSTIPGRR